MTVITPAPVYSLPRAAWIPTLVIWRADGHFTRLEGAPRGLCGGAGPRAGGCGWYK